MGDGSRQRNNAEKPFDAFKDLATKLVKVPKKEVDKAEAAYKREHKHPKRGPKPSEN